MASCREDAPARTQQQKPAGRTAPPPPVSLSYEQIIPGFWVIDLRASRERYAVEVTSADELVTSVRLRPGARIRLVAHARTDTLYEVAVVYPEGATVTHEIPIPRYRDKRPPTTTLMRKHHVDVHAGQDVFFDIRWLSGPNSDAEVLSSVSLAVVEVEEGSQPGPGFRRSQ
jgi:hypothetical protein